QHNANAPIGADEEEAMMKLNGSRGVAAVNAVALTVLLGACGDDRDAQARAAEGGIVLAQATPGPSIESVPVSIETPVPEPARVYTNVKYGDAESVFRKGRYEESAAMFGVY